MAGNRRHDSPGAENGARDFFTRWSERKRAASDDTAVPESAPVPPPAERADAGGEQKVLTDKDMPPLESLDEDSDYSVFLSPGVSETLQRLALRKLFGAAKFQVRDGLDDYDNDYNLLVPLRRDIAEAVQEEVTRQVSRDVRDKIVLAEAPDAAGAESRPDAGEAAGTAATPETPADRDQETGQ
jgi:hypothetical protein